ncbi:PREDICTED: uncharacterized protein LOC105448736 [Wasmannia auropunctata]|uniref:uncharacterized protein LOC105448736 n=1 Tax=Wasmannia auropunctata TaxID=64793 RepID=UPI0005EF561C|nr:PREDICTED: uncharacterized protein LOC105448736 [Wasmannia auropunctata]
MRSPLTHSVQTPAIYPTKHLDSLSKTAPPHSHPPLSRQPSRPGQGDSETEEGPPSNPTAPHTLPRRSPSLTEGDPAGRTIGKDLPSGFPPRFTFPRRPPRSTAGKVAGRPTIATATPRSRARNVESTAHAHAQLAPPTWKDRSHAKIPAHPPRNPRQNLAEKEGPGAQRNKK